MPLSASISHRRTLLASKPIDVFMVHNRALDLGKIFVLQSSKVSRCSWQNHGLLWGLTLQKRGMCRSFVACAIVLQSVLARA